MHGFGMHVGVCYQYWGGRGHSWACVCAFRKWWDPEAVICLSMGDFSGDSQERASESVGSA